MSDSVCPAICCNPAKPDCDYMAEIKIAAGARNAERGTLVAALVLGGLI
jgi:hypothetical protein